MKKSLFIYAIVTLFLLLQLSAMARQNQHHVGIGIEQASVKELDEWAKDILVTNYDINDEYSPSLDEAPNGDLYMVVNVTDPESDLHFYKSVNGGISWSHFFSMLIPGGCGKPSLTYAETEPGINAWLYVAYSKPAELGLERIVVCRFDPANPYNNNDCRTVGEVVNYFKRLHPEICTDYLNFPDYFVYVTYEGSDIESYQTYFSRSMNYGLNWTTPVNVGGGAENSSARNGPDITFGSGDNLFVTFVKQGWNGYSWIDQIWISRSTNYGYSWEPPRQLTSNYEANYHPRVAASPNVDSVLVVFTIDYTTDTDVQYLYSMDKGDNWNYGTLPWTYDDEKNPELTVSRSNGLYHAAFWRNNNIHYTSTSVDNPVSWKPTAIVGDIDSAAENYRPAVGIDPTKPVDEEGCVAWSDYRNEPLDVYFDKISTFTGPNVTVSLAPVSTTVPRGGKLTYKVTATNQTAATQCFHYWTNVTLPNGYKYPPSGELFGPLYLCLNSKASKTATLSEKIPVTTKLGTYTYNGHVGPYPTIWDKDSFNFTLTATTTKEEATDWETMVDSDFSELKGNDRE